MICHKKATIILILSLFFIQKIQAQYQRVQLVTMFGERINGYIIQADSTELKLTRTWRKSNWKQPEKYRIIPAKAIKKILFKGKNRSGLLGSLFGLTGLTMGYTTGAILDGVFVTSILGPAQTGNSKYRTKFSLIGTAAGTGFGVSLGLLYRKTIHEFLINGEIENYQFHLGQLQIVELP